MALVGPGVLTGMLGAEGWLCPMSNEGHGINPLSEGEQISAIAPFSLVKASV